MRIRRTGCASEYRYPMLTGSRSAHSARIMSRPDVTRNTADIWRHYVSALALSSCGCPAAHLGGRLSQAQAAPRTAPGARRLAPLMAALFAVLITFLTLAGPAPAMAQETGAPTDQPSEVGLDENPNRVSGNVLLNSEPLEGVHITVAGGGYTADVWTNAEGQWKVGVPE